MSGCLLYRLAVVGQRSRDRRGEQRRGGEEAWLWEDGDAGEPLLRDAEPALRWRVAVGAPQRLVVGGCRCEVPSVDVGRGAGLAQGCVSSVRQRVAELCPLGYRAKCLHGGDRKSRWPSLPAMMSWVWPGPSSVFCRTVSWDATQSAFCSSALLRWELARSNQNGCSACCPRTRRLS